MKNKLKIFYVSSEVFPFAKTDELGEVSGAYPKYIKNLGHDIRVMMPNYQTINERKYVLRDVIRLQGLKIKLGDKEFTADTKSAFIPDSKVQIYFLDNKEYFERQGLYSEIKTGKEYSDNAERYIFFSMGCLETLKLLCWQPDIIHCNDWQTAIIPILLKTLYRDDSFFKNTKTLLSIHKVTQQGNFDASVLQKTGIHEYLEDCNDARNNGDFSFLRAGLEYADMLNTTSESHADEIHDYLNGSNEEPKKRKHQFFGILNGVDKQVWNPETDKLIPFNYNNSDFSGKIKNKEELRKKFGLEMDPKIPVISTILKLDHEKGIDLVLDIVDQLMKLKVQLIVLGQGEKKYHDKLKVIQKKHKGKIGLEFSFDNTVAHLVQAGSDMLMMPSRFEPCGLNQMYGLAYGTIPIVQRTGGLKDTVKNFSEEKLTGTGFIFDKPESREFLKVVKSAVKFYNDEKIWSKLVHNAMRENFSWETPAQKYIKLYQKLMSTRNIRK